MNNFDNVEKALTLALDANGSAINENAAYMESLEAKTNNLKATFQDLATNVIDDELVGAVLDLANGLLQLANTDLGRIVTQITLLTGVGWGATSLAKVADVVGAAGNSFNIFFSIMKNGAAATAASLSTATKTVSTFGAVMGGALPVVLALAAALAIGGALWKATEDSRKSIDDLNDSIETDNQKLQTNKERIEEINNLSWDDKTPEILAEKDALEKENAELQEQIEKYQQLKEEKAQAILDNAYTTETTYTTKRVRGKETTVPVTELVEGAKYYEQLTSKLQKYQTILSQNKSLTSEQVVEYNKLITEAGRLASAMENTAGGVASCTNEQQLLYNAFQSTQAAYNEAQTYISNYVNKLLEQASTTTTAKKEMYNLAAQMIVTNNQKLDFSQQIAAMRELAIEAGATTSVIAGVMGITEAASKRNLAAWMQTINPVTGKYYTKDEAQQKLLSKYWEKLQTKINFTPVTTGGGGTGNTVVEDVKDEVEEVEKAADTAVTNVSNSISDAVEDTSSQIQDALNEQKSMMEDIIDYYVEYASRKIEEIEGQLDAINAKYDEMLDTAQQRYDDQLQALEDQYNAVEDQYELQKLMDNLEKAKKTYQMVYRDGQFVYEVDAEAVREAQEALSAYKRKKEYEERKKQLEESLKTEKEYIESLRKAETEALEDEKERWEEYKKGWSELTSEYEYQQNELLAEQMFGAEQENATWETRLANLSSFVAQYKALMAQIAAAQASTSGGGGSSGGGTSGGSSGSGTSGGVSGGDFVVNDPNDPSTWNESYAQKHYSEGGYDSFSDWWREQRYGLGYKGELQSSGTSAYNELVNTDWAAELEDQFKQAAERGYIISDALAYYIKKRQDKIATLGITDVETTEDLFNRLYTKYLGGNDTSSDDGNRESGKSSSSLTAKERAELQSQLIRLEDEIGADPNNSSLKRQADAIAKQLGVEAQYAGGTLSATGGLAMVGEQGPELRVLSRGDGVIPADITRNLMKIGANPKWFAKQAGSSNTILNVSNVSLPSVQNAQQFVDGLKNLALQKAYGRT